MKPIAAMATLATLFLVAISHLPAGQPVYKNELPGNAFIECDARLLELQGEGIPEKIRGAFKIIKTRTHTIPKDPKLGEKKDKEFAIWVLELQKDKVDLDAVRRAWGLTPLDTIEVGPTILFIDKEKVKIGELPLLLDGFHYRMKRGDCVRVILRLPEDGMFAVTRYARISE